MVLYNMSVAGVRVVEFGTNGDSSARGATVDLKHIYDVTDHQSDADALLPMLVNVFSPTVTMWAIGYATQPGRLACLTSVLALVFVHDVVTLCWVGYDMISDATFHYRLVCFVPCDCLCRTQRDVDYFLSTSVLKGIYYQKTADVIAEPIRYLLSQWQPCKGVCPLCRMQCLLWR